MAVIPSGLHPGRIVAATAGGGIWTSDDNGAHWEPRTDNTADLAIGSVVDDPSEPNHLIAGTGEANQCSDCYVGAGVLVSTDGGQSWSLQNPGGVFGAGQEGVDIAGVAIDPTNSSHEFAATTSGLFVTSNGGVSWSKPNDPSYAPLDGDITAVVINPKTPTTIYLGGGPQGVGKSTDGGVHWAAARTGLTVPAKSNFPFTALAIAPSSPTTLYASVGSLKPVALYKTVNGATSWSHVTATPDYTSNTYAYGESAEPGDAGWYDNVVAIDPTNANHVLVGGVTVIETTDGGSTWSNANGQKFFGTGTNKFHPDQHALAFRSDGKVWLGDDGGVYLYTPSNGTVANANGDLNITQLYFGFNVVNGTVLAGAQDNATARTSSQVAGPWTGIEGGDGGPSAIVPNEPSTQFTQETGHLRVSNDAFAAELEAKEITPPEKGLFTPPMTIVPNTISPPNPTVFFGAKDLWRTTNPSAASPTWTKVTSIGKYVSAIVASPVDPNVIYVGFVSGVIQVSTDGGATFHSIAAQPFAVDTWVTGLSVDPTNPKAIAASFSFSDTRYNFALPHVALYSYSATPNSGSWSVITGNLPTVAVSRVVYDNAALVAATDQGVYATGAPAGESTAWTRVGTGLPNVQVQDLDVEPDGLYALTHGRGAWKLPTAAAPTVTKVSPNKGPVGGGTTVTITGTNFTGATAVEFGATSATSFKVVSGTSITAVSPAESAGTVNLAVTTPGGTSPITSADRFSFTPTIASLSPNTGSKAGGTKVTVTGTGFALGTTATTFKFGTAKATSINCASATTCTVISPAHEVGKVDVHATVNKVTSAKTGADGFTYF